MNSFFVSYARFSSHILRVVCLVALCAAGVAQTPVQPSAQNLELTRTIRSWEFLPVVGTRAGLFGNETGQFEAWVYPLKIFREFHLIFHVGDRALPAETLARTLTVRPESASILYVGDSFRVRESPLCAGNEPGAVILLEIETEQPLEIEAAFMPDFQLEWPAGLGGTYVNWDARERALFFGEEARKFAAIRWIAERGRSARRLRNQLLLFAGKLDATGSVAPRQGHEGCDYGGFSGWPRRCRKKLRTSRDELCKFRA